MSNGLVLGALAGALSETGYEWTMTSKGTAVTVTIERGATFVHVGRAPERQRFTRTFPVPSLPSALNKPEMAQAVSGYIARELLIHTDALGAEVGAWLDAKEAEGEAA